MKNIILALMLSMVFYSSSLYAMGSALGLGGRKTYVDALNGTDQGKSSVHFGGLVWIKLMDSIDLRTGVMYTQRMFQTILPTTETRDHNFTYIDVPLTLSYKVSSGAQIFVGAIYGAPLDDLVSSSVSGSVEPTGARENIFPLTLGLTMTFTEKFKLELFYEQESKKLYDDVENVRAVGATLLYFFGEVSN